MNSKAKPEGKLNLLRAKKPEDKLISTLDSAVEEIGKLIKKSPKLSDEEIGFLMRMGQGIQYTLVNLRGWIDSTRS